LNTHGQMIGLNTAIFSQTGGFMGIGFAVPSKIAKQVSDEIIDHGRVIRGWIGLTAQDMDKDLSRYFKTPEEQGALIAQISPNGPAQAASLRSGDVVLKYNGTPVTGASNFKTLVAATKAGTSVPVEISREGKVEKINVLIREQAAPHKLGPATQMAGKAGGKAPHPTIGVGVEDIPPELLKMFHNEVPNGGALVTSVRPGSPAFDAGLAPGDVVLRANNTEVHNAHDFLQIARAIKDKDVAVLYVQKGPDERVYVPVKIEG
ncbi:MAG: PDZ domain-containing protein, partial [Bdellovibrionota bacterium]